MLNRHSPVDYIPRIQEMTLEEIFAGAVEMVAGDKATEGRKLRKPEIFPKLKVFADKFLLTKILSNMLLNAYEATDKGRAVRFWVDCGKQELTFCVWNHKEIPESMRLRIFQRNYTTKVEEGRGQGTYAMKIFGETFLGGSLKFETSKDRGTVFKFTLPLKPKN